LINTLVPGVQLFNKEGQRATEKEYYGGEGHILILSLSFSNYLFPNSYESLHNIVPIVTAGCRFYIACA